MPKLLQINATANWGSTGKIAEAIGILAMNNGWESVVAYGRKANPSRSDIIRVGGSLNPYFHFAQQYLFDAEGQYSSCATKQLVMKMKEIKPDIVQLHNIHDHWLNYPLLFEYLNKTDVKVVWTFHDCWAFTGHCYHFVHSNCNKWKSECYDCPQRKGLRDCSTRNYKMKKDLFVGNKSLTIIPVSQWMASFVHESFFKEKDIRIIHNGIDLNIFTPKEKIKSANFKILAVSNVWHQNKGLYDVFELRKLLPQEYEITMVGLSEMQLYALPKGINGMQRTQNVEELVQLYSESDVFINPTYADTFPTVNMESLACGTPVITYNTGGSPETINESTGVVVPQGDVRALADAIIRMKNNPLSSAKCRDRAEKYFDKDKCFRQYIELYEELLREKEEKG